MIIVSLILGKSVKSNVQQHIQTLALNVLILGTELKLKLKTAELKKKAETFFFSSINNDSIINLICFSE